jgi:hypothetical protein
MPRNLHLSLPLILTIAATASAQRLASYDPFVGQMSEVEPPTTILPATTAPYAAYLSAPALPAMPVVFGMPQPGDATSDTRTGLLWYSNGGIIAQMPSPSIPATAAPAPAFPIGGPALAAIGGMATGIALDPVLNILWLVGNAGNVVGVAPVAGTPIVVPPFPLPFPAGPIAGLEWDGITANLLAVDVAGTTYRFTPGGIPAAAPIPFPMPMPGAVAGDVAIDKSGVVNASGQRAIWVSMGNVAIDVTMAPLPAFRLAAPAGAVGAGTGLAYLPIAASTVPVGGCTCGGVTPQWAPTGPMTSGNALYGERVTNLPAGQLVLFGIDFVWNPALPLINTTGCPLGLLAGSGTMLTTIGFASAAGIATRALPLAVPPGFGPLYLQAFTPCAADPSGFQVTPLRQIGASGT